MQDEITWCIRHAQPIPLWQNFLHFTDSPLFVFGVGAHLLLGCMILIYFYTEFEKHPLDMWSSVIITLQTALGFSSNFNPQHKSFRAFFHCALFTPLCFVTVFNASMFVILTHPLYQHQIHTIDELKQFGYKLAGDEYARTILKNDAKVSFWFDRLLRIVPHHCILLQYSWYQMQQFNICKEIDDCLTRLQFTEQLAVATSRRHALSLNLLDVYCFDRSQDIQTYLNSFLIRTKCKHRTEIDSTMKRIIMAGLVTKWQKDFKKPMRQAENTRSVGIMKLDNLNGFIYLFGLMFGIITLIFFLEILIFKKSHSRRANRYWKFAHMLINTKRYFKINR